MDKRRRRVESGKAKLLDWDQVRHHWQTMIQIRISDDVFTDLDDGYWFYELQDAGLGDYFARTLRSDIEC